MGAARAGAHAVRTVDAFLADLPADVEPITPHVAARAAHRRAEHQGRIRLRDALVLAMALHMRADRLATTDRRWPFTGLHLEIVG